MLQLMRQSFISIVLVLLFASLQTVAKERSRLSVKGTIDANIFFAHSQQSWLSGDMGKHRVGEGDNSILLQSAISIDYDLSLQSGFTLEAAYYSDSDRKVGITQAFWHYKALATEHWRSNYKMGAFHIPISLENPGALWHSLYTVTPSMINTWIGEELRTIGVQGRWSWRLSRTSQHKITPIAAFFKGNDSAGAMIAWRGWAAHNRQSLLGETIQLPALPVIQPDAPFAEQAPEFEPFVEVDDNIGYYVGLEWKYNRKIKLNYLYYDNRGDPLALKNGQYAWDTRFHHLGFKAKFEDHWTLVSQIMFGNTVMGPGAVDNDFRSAFILVSKKSGSYRYSARVESFRVTDLDFLSTLDPNNESGERITFSYSYQIKKNLLATMELAQLRSDRAYRSVFELNEQLNENQGIIQIRYLF